MSMQVVLEALAIERSRQDAKWGDQNHEAPTWMLIATEELGEVSKAALQGRRAEYFAELIQLTAVCVAWLECEFRRDAREAERILENRRKHTQSVEEDNAKRGVISPFILTIRDENGRQFGTTQLGANGQDAFESYKAQCSSNGVTGVDQWQLVGHFATSIYD